MKLCSLVSLIFWCSIFPRPNAAAPLIWQIVHLKMTDPARGWAIADMTNSYHVLHTRDGGKRWADVSPEGFSNEAPSDWNHDIDQGSVGSCFLDSRTGWLCVRGGSQQKPLLVVYHTIDSGQHWLRRPFPASGGDYRIELQFLDHERGFILALGGPAAGMMEKRVYRTTNGGRTWHFRGPVFGGFYPSGMTFRSATEGWMTGTYHGDPDVPFFHTRDGGRTWRRQTLPIPARYQGGYANTSGPLFFGSKPRQGILYATLIGPDTYPRPGRLHDEAVFITRTAGADWQYRKYPRSCLGLSDVCFADTQHGWILDGNGQHLYETRNDGRTWRLLTSRFNQQTPTDKDWDTRTSLDFVSAQVGWALATADNQTLNRHQFALMKTRDGGQHWVYLQPRLHRLWRKN